MSLQHKKLVRIGDEYCCAFCGKSWSIDDTDPPACEVDVAIVGKGVHTFRSAATPYGFYVSENHHLDDMYIIGLETPQGWKGCAIYAKSGEKAMRYFMGSFGHRLTQLQCNALVLDKVIGGNYNGSLVIPHAELRTSVLSVKSKHDTASGVKYELLSPINFVKAVNPNE